MRYITLDNFIRLLAAILDDPEAKRTYTKLLRLTISELQTLNLTSIPNVETKILTVNANNTIDLPESAIRPLHAGKYLKINGKGGVYPLGKKSAGFELAIKPNNGFDCAPSNIEDTDVVFSYQNYNRDTLDLLYIDSFYGERYGFREDRVFGYWSFDKEWGRMIFEDGFIEPGDQVVVKYNVYNDDFKVIPLELKDVLQYKVLHTFYLNSNIRKAAYHNQKFKMEFSRYKRSVLDGYSYDDWINAIQKGYYSGPK